MFASAEMDATELPEVPNTRCTSFGVSATSSLPRGDVVPTPTLPHTTVFPPTAKPFVGPTPAHAQMLALPVTSRELTGLVLPIQTLPLFETMNFTDGLEFRLKLFQVITTNPALDV